MDQKTVSAAKNESTALIEGSTTKIIHPKKSRFWRCFLFILAFMLAAGLLLQTQYLRSQQNFYAKRLNQFEQNTRTEQQQFRDLFTAQSDENKQNMIEQRALVQELTAIKQKMSSLTGEDSNQWLLAETEYLIKLASRKLSGEQDVQTASALLKNADNNLSRLNDDVLIPIRQALAKDLETLSTVNYQDDDEIILKLNQLTSEIDALPLAASRSDDKRSPSSTPKPSLSTSPVEWRENLQKSWENFLDHFITFRRRDTNIEPLISSEQEAYLRENIRLRLLMATRALFRHKDELFRSELDSVSNCVKREFLLTDAKTQNFLNTIDLLRQQTISSPLPELTSPALLKTLSEKPLLMTPDNPVPSSILGETP